MRIHVLTLFPDIIAELRHYGVIGRAIQRKSLELGIVNIRDFSLEKHGKVDDAPYGGGAGMLMTCQPIADAIDAVRTDSTRVIYLSPQGSVLTHEKAKELASAENLILLCGHYEGIDDRLLSTHIDEELSIGDYVLTGGELAAMVVIDAVSRHIEDTVGDVENVETDSLSDGLLKYPQYTRPRFWNRLEVPEILLCGDHKKIQAWREELSKETTQAKRPDLWEAHLQKKE